MDTKSIRPFIVNMYIRIALMGQLCKKKSLGESLTLTLTLTLTQLCKKKSLDESLSKQRD